MRALCILGILFIALAFNSASSQSWAQPLLQITSCVELAPAVIGASRKAASTRADCNPGAALSKAMSQSHANARDALAPICRQGVSAARAAATCAAVGKGVPTTRTQVSAPPVSAAGMPPIDAELGIPGSTRVCVVLRDLPGESSTTLRPNPLCLFGFQETVVTFRSRARCGVQCFP
jgi:hypothetical protein